jgi:lipopolysaccharide export system protein LptA
MKTGARATRTETRSPWDGGEPDSGGFGVDPVALSGQISNSGSRIRGSRMAVSLLDCLRCRPGHLLAVSILGLVLIVGGGTQARAQVEGDTSRMRPTGVEPAEVDSLPAGDLAPPFRAAEPSPSPADTGDVERAFVQADSLSTLQRRGEQIQELFGNVFVRQDTTRLRSQYARRYLNRDEILFIEDVVIYERGDTLRADSVRYDRAREVGYARGHVRLTDGDVDVRADRATYYSTDKRAVFPDSVVLVDSNRVLRAQSGTYWSEEARAEFGGGVRLTEPGTTLLSDSLTYYRDQDRSIARGAVFVDRRGDEEAEVDTTSRTYLFGDWVDNQEARRYSRVEGNALLMRVRMDSTGAPTDTLVVRARRLEAFRTDTHRRLVAVDAVRIWQPDLAAVADSAVYDRVVAPIPDSAEGGTVPIDTTRSPSDSLTLAASRPPPRAEPPTQQGARTDSVEEDPAEQRGAGDAPTSTPTPPDTTARANPSRPPPSADSIPRSRSRARRGPRRWDTPTAQSDSVLPLEETRLFQSPMIWFEDSQVWGDSIRVRARTRSPDTIFVRGSGFAAQRDSVLDRIQQLKAQNIVAFFNGDALRRIRARPNARAIRFLTAENDSLNGAARTSGDRITLRFADGAVKRISVVGGTQTTYYRKNENIPDPFRLEGFQWTPDRRPTRSRLLRDERVRQRLDVDLAPRSQPVAGPVSRRSPRPGPASPPDSTARTASPQRPQRRPAPESPAADSLRHGGPVPPDSGGSAEPHVPADTSETKRNLNP